LVTGTVKFATRGPKNKRCVHMIPLQEVQEDAAVVA
jgi:hypothetical protein